MHYIHDDYNMVVKRTINDAFRNYIVGMVQPGSQAQISNVWYCLVLERRAFADRLQLTQDIGVVLAKIANDPGIGEEF